MAKQTVTFEGLPMAVETLNNNVETLIELMRVMDNRLSAIESSLGNQDVPLDVEQASELIKRTKGTLYKMVCNKELPFHKKGNRLYFYKKELLSWLETGCTNPTTSTSDATTSTLLSTTIETPTDTPYQKLLRKNLRID